MTISMCEVLCVANRKLCPEPLPVRIRKIAECRPAGIILREKDLPETAYQALAAEVLAICRHYDVPCILHSFPAAAAALGAENLHMPLAGLLDMESGLKKQFRRIGASVHAPEEAEAAAEGGAAYLIAGHIFETDCKKGLPGRGTAFLRTVCQRVQIPVYAIGGITPENAAAVTGAGAKGICLMSSLMQCREPAELLRQFQEGC